MIQESGATDIVIGPKRISFACAVLATGIVAVPAAAQPAAHGVSREGFQEIIVTARKRDETSLAVPVVVSVVSPIELERRAINNLDGVSRLVPQLMIAPNTGSTQGGTVSIRGVSGPDNNPFGDQAVSFNIDGVQIGKATVRRMSEMDIERIEVLKGPQALFFGKNSPAGIVSVRSADPTPQLSAQLKLGYEFVGREKRAEGYIAGPFGDAVGFRLAGYFSDLNGYLKNNIPDGAFLALTDRVPKSRDYALRGTLKFNPGADFNARLKISYADLSDSGQGQTTQLISCPYGAPQSGSVDSCEADDRTIHASSGPIVGTFDPLFGDGDPFVRQQQWLASFELNYHLTDSLLLTSISGLYHVEAKISENFENDYSTALPSATPYKDRQLSQELRLTSNFESPLNFTLGAFAADTAASTGAHTFLFGAEPASPFFTFCTRAAPCQINNYFLKQKGTAYSAFGQISYDPVPTVEVTVGGRYSYERKALPLVQDGTGIGVPGPLGFAVANVLDDSTIRIPVVGRKSWKDFSPEATITWRPTQKLTLFGSYKQGFLSGGFNSNATDFSRDLSYDPQTIEGFETGVKALLFDNRLQANLAGYTYKVNDLQVTAYTNAVGSIRNAGAVRVKGVELDFSYQPPVTGLSVSGAVAYNHGRYISFPAAPCYNGQTTAQGCMSTPAAPIQNLSGTELVRAPKWNATGAVNYDTVVERFKLGFSASFTHSSSYLTDPASSPNGRQPSYTLIDAAMRVGDADDVWQLALIGRNLTDEYYFSASSDVPFTGTTATGLPGDDAGQRLADRFAAVGRGREILVQATYRFGK